MQDNLEANTEQGDVTKSITVGPDQKYFGPKIKLSDKARNKIKDLAFEYLLHSNPNSQEECIDKIEQVINSQKIED